MLRFCQNFSDTQMWQLPTTSTSTYTEMRSKKCERSLNEIDKKERSTLSEDVLKSEVPPGFGPGNEGFADLCLTTWLWHHKDGAVDEIRTRDIHLGKVALYQLSYYRIYGALGRNRTTDTVDFQSTALPTELPRHMATRKGLEPSTSSVTGWHSNQLNYRHHIGGNNRARTCDPSACKADALPAELCSPTIEPLTAAT